MLTADSKEAIELIKTYCQGGMILEHHGKFIADLIEQQSRIVEAARNLRKIQIDQQASVLLKGDILLRNSAEDRLDNALRASIDGGKS
jgi:hypothetical protein